jgi:hypothetical protein
MPPAVICRSRSRVAPEAKPDTVQLRTRFVVTLQLYAPRYPSPSGSTESEAVPSDAVPEAVFLSFHSYPVALLGCLSRASVLD